MRYAMGRARPISPTIGPENDRNCTAQCSLAAGLAKGSVIVPYPMKTLRLLAVLSIASLFTAPFALAADSASDKASEKTCDCEKDKDGKTCGVDKDCCCTGKKATKPAEKSEKKD